jgi:hypothetical protein
MIGRFSPAGTWRIRGGTSDLRLASAWFSCAAPTEACHSGDASAAGDRDTIVAATSITTTARSAPNTPPSRRSTGFRGDAWTSALTNFVSRPHTTMAARKVSAKATRWLIAEPGLPIGR